MIIHSTETGSSVVGASAGLPTTSLIEPAETTVRVRTTSFATLRAAVVLILGHWDCLIRYGEAGKKGEGKKRRSHGLVSVRHKIEERTDVAYEYQDEEMLLLIESFWLYPC